jgi:hypothetical protein
MPREYVHEAHRRAVQNQTGTGGGERTLDREGIAALVRDPGDPSGTPAYFVLLEWVGGSVVTIRDFRHARYAAEGAELFVRD